MLSKVQIFFCPFFKEKIMSYLPNVKNILMILIICISYLFGAFTERLTYELNGFQKLSFVIAIGFMFLAFIILTAIKMRIEKNKEVMLVEETLDINESGYSFLIKVARLKYKEKYLCDPVLFNTNDQKLFELCFNKQEFGNLIKNIDQLPSKYFSIKLKF
jgi:hypothetical protein